MSETPLSDLMDTIFAGNTNAYMDLVKVFPASSVGVIAHNVPTDTYGPVISDDEHPLSVGMTKYGGKKYILVCADFAVFMKRYPGPFNGEMTGVDAFKTVLAHPDTDGVFINSAKSENSLIIYRKDIEEYLGVPASSPPRWWQFWKK